MRQKPAQQLMAEAKQHCDSVAQGPFTPLVFHRYVNAFSGKVEFLVGRPSGNRGGIVWA